MFKMEVKRWDNEKIIVCGESVRDCLVENKDKNFYKADLRSADLRSADLRSADLRSADLRSADLRSADLRSADLRSADLRFADLRSADLRFASLWSADLRFADLWSADLQGADLQDADLRFSDLWSAKYEEPLFLPDLYSLKLLPPETKLTFWKYLKNGESPYQEYQYEVGREYSSDEFDNNEANLCGTGLNVATLTWCLKDSFPADEFIEVEFLAGDIIAIPYATDGKFRVKKLKVLRQINRKEAIKELERGMIPSPQG